jgi:hypothetical protein
VTRKEVSQFRRLRTGIASLARSSLKVPPMLLARADWVIDNRDQPHSECLFLAWLLLTTPWGFPCCVRFPCVHAVATTPAQRLGSSLSFSQPYQPSPKGLSGRPAHCPFRGLLSVHSRSACTLALSPIRDTLIECFNHFVASMTALIASGWSGLPGGVRTHWKAPPCHGAHPKQTSSQTSRIPFSNWSKIMMRSYGSGGYCPN